MSFLITVPLMGLSRNCTTQIAVNDDSHIEETIAKVKLSESKLRRLRQQIEYQMRKHRFQEFRERA